MKTKLTIPVMLLSLALVLVLQNGAATAGDMGTAAHATFAVR